MDLVDCQGLIERLLPGPPGHPRLVLPFEASRIPDNRRRPGTQLGGKSVRVGLLHEIATVTALDLELVHLTLAQIRNEELPDSSRPTIDHGMAAAIPVIEVSDH